MGQAGDEHPIISPPHKPAFRLAARLLFFGVLLGMGGACSSPPLWVRSGESCTFESQTPPLRRIINYGEPELCDRQPLFKKKRQKRLRELFPQE